MPRFPRQIWWVAGLAALLTGLLLPILLDKRPEVERIEVSWLAPRPTAEPSRAVTPTPLPTDTMTATGTLPLASSPTLQPSPSETAGPSSPLPRGTEPPREDHYWLQRPVASTQNDGVARSYPYASRLDGTYPVHHGVEFVNAIGTTVLAVADGTIVVAGDDDLQVFGARNGFYGLLIIQRLDRQLDGQEVYVLYAHLSQIDVSMGQPVRDGDAIGRVGMSGYAEGPHVHMEVRFGVNDYGRTVNPELWLQPRPGRGTLAGVVLGPDGFPLSEARLVLYRSEAPTTPYRYVTIYPAHQVNPDPSWGENFATGDLPSGEYRIQAFVGNQLHMATAVVGEGATTWIALPSAGQRPGSSD